MIVTISASYGAGGSRLGPRLAERLGVPFLDRAVPVGVADELGISVEDAAALEQDTPNRIWDVLASMSPMAGFTPAPVMEDVTTGKDLIRAMEARLHTLAEAGDGVVLGHGAAVVLADLPGALHVRLDGSPEGRVRAAMRQHGIDADEAEAKRKENDRVRDGYVKHFYHRRSADSDLYDLVLDTVRLGQDLAEELILRAAQADG